MGQTYTGLSGKTKDDFGHGQARFVTYMNVFSNPISNPEMTEPIEIDPKQNEVEVGDVFFTTSSETPEEVGMSSILLEKRGKTYLNSFCFGFRPSEKIDSYYLAYMLRSESTRAKIILLAQGISRYNISKNKVMEIAVSLPSLDEQKMIGQYFSQLDNLITLHQRQHFLHSTPDISLSVRLIHPFYTSSWEQRKLGEVAKYRNGKAHENCIDESGKYIVVNSKFVSTNGTVIKHSNMQNEPLAQNEIAFVLSDVPNGRAIARTFLVEENDKYTLNQRIAGITSSENTYPYFLHILMNRHPYFLAFDDGVKQTNLSVSDVLNFETYYPEYEEQKQIGEYFRNLDRLITLHQRKGKAAVSGCSNDANNSKGVCCKARDFGYKCHKKDEPNRFDA